MGDSLFHRRVPGPYGQLTHVDVTDHGNGLPISITVANTDPPHGAENSLCVRDAEIFHRWLGVAIDVAKGAGLER